MAIKSREDLIASVSAIIGEEPDENGVALLEDITDTITDFEDKTKEDWKAKYEENDKAWRKKYTDRFMKGSEPSGVNEPDLIDDNEPEKPKTFNDLFKQEGK